MGSTATTPIQIKISIVKANLYPSSLPKVYNGEIYVKIKITGSKSCQLFEKTNRLNYFLSAFSLENDKKLLELSPKHKSVFPFIFILFFLLILARNWNIFPHFPRWKLVASFFIENHLNDEEDCWRYLIKKCHF